jgi:hypothetical protein
MARSKKSAPTIDDLMERASAALAKTDYFECERISVDALERAHAAKDYDRMARILMPLQEARRQKRDRAIDASLIVVLEEPIPEEEPLEPAVYLVQPPLVGADGRDLRERADREGVPALVVVREPTTRLGLVPIVMIGPVTVRARVEKPADEESPDLPWIIAASEALGDAALAQLADDLGHEQRVDQTYDRLCTCAEHDRLHQVLAEACKIAAAAVARGEVDPKARKTPLARGGSRRAG